MNDELWQCPMCPFTATFYRNDGQGQPYSGEVPWLLRTQRHLLEHLVTKIAADPEKPS